MTPSHGDGGKKGQETGTAAAESTVTPPSKPKKEEEDEQKTEGTESVVASAIQPEHPLQDTEDEAKSLRRKVWTDGFCGMDRRRSSLTCSSQCIYTGIR